MTQADPVLVSFDEAVAHIRFNRPDTLNVIDVSMAEAFRDAVSSVLNRDGVRVILLSGEGRAFMAGGDLASFRAAGEGAPEVARAIIARLAIACAMPELATARENRDAEWMPYLFNI